MTEDRRDDILRKVQALLAKAMSTPFEGEADVFRAKANQLMDAYRIEQWEIAKAAEGKISQSSLKPVRRDISIEWWWTEEHYSALWSIFTECARTCAVIVAHSHISGRDKTIPVYGLESDIGFMQMLFTDLYIQMSAKIKPEYDSHKSLGENVYNAKEAGMKYKDIAVWTGHPEWVTRKNGKTEINGILIREMKKHATANGLTVHKEISLTYYVADFVNSYSFAVTNKLREMRADDTPGQSMAIAIRDITDLSREIMWTDFPDMRPHPEGCECSVCKPVVSTKPVKFRKSDYRSTNPTATARGAKAGSQARIMGKTEAVKGRPDHKKLS